MILQYFTVLTVIIWNPVMNVGKSNEELEMWVQFANLKDFEKSDELQQVLQSLLDLRLMDFWTRSLILLNKTEFYGLLQPKRVC